MRNYQSARELADDPHQLRQPVSSGQVVSVPVSQVIRKSIILFRRRCSRAFGGRRIWLVRHKARWARSRRSRKFRG
jgi:hypothetical protein